MRHSYFALLKRAISGVARGVKLFSPVGLRTLGFHKNLLLPEKVQGHSTCSEFMLQLSLNALQ
jgi:hypothetical protein